MTFILTWALPEIIFVLEGKQFHFHFFHFVMSLLFFIVYHFTFLICSRSCQSVFSHFFFISVPPSSWFSDQTFRETRNVSAISMGKTSRDCVDIESQWQCTCVRLNNVTAVSRRALLDHKDSWAHCVWLTLLDSQSIDCVHNQLVLSYVLLWMLIFCCII